MKEAGKESASAQEIAEKALHEMHDAMAANVCDDSTVRSIILSAITAAVAQKDETIKELHRIAVEKDRLWSEACNERNALARLLQRLRESIVECESEATLHEVDEYLTPRVAAAVAQATKELQDEVDEQAMVILQGLIAVKKERNLRNTDQIIEIDEKGRVHPEGALDFMQPVAQAKEEEKLSVTMRTCVHHNDAERAAASIFDDGKDCPVCAKRALELKEPATEPNLTTQITLTMKSFPDQEGFWLLVRDKRPHLHAKLLWVRRFGGEWRQCENNGNWWNCMEGTWFQLPIEQLSRIVLSKKPNEILCRIR